MSDITPDLLFERSTALLSSNLGELTVMMDLDEGTYYGLNAVGARIWALLEEPTSIRAVCDRLCREYEVERAGCEQAVTRFVEELLGRGMVVRSEG